MWVEIKGLIDKAKVMHASEATQRIHSPLPMGRLVFSHPQKCRTPSQVMVKASL